jgi:hypothetical protein
MWQKLMAASTATAVPPARARCPGAAAVAVVSLKASTPVFSGRL